MREAESISRKQAKRLRTEMTKAEIILWSQLKGHNLNGNKVHRQLPIGPYIVDFACKAKRLVIEVGGATHSTDMEVKHDLRRTAFLEDKGWQIMRVNNLDIYKNLTGVLEVIGSKLPPPSASPPPPPQAGAERNSKSGELPHD